MSNIKEIKNEENEESFEQTEQKKNDKKKNFLENDKTIESLQLSIQRISKQIEEYKINLRILQERHTKKLSEYNQLEGKPIIKSREQKMEEMKEKMEKLKNHQVFDPNYGKKEIILQPGEETKMIQNNTDKCKIELDNLIDSINKQVLLNKKLSQEIEEIRKEKYRIFEKMDKNDKENKKIEKEIKELTNRNERIYRKIQFKELNKVK